MNIFQCFTITVHIIKVKYFIMCTFRIALGWLIHMQYVLLFTRMRERTFS